MATRRQDIEAFLTRHQITLKKPYHFFNKADLILEIKRKNIQKTFVVDEMAKKYGHVVLRLPPYHCALNPIEMIWSKVKGNARSMNSHPGNAAEVVDMLRRACDTVTNKDWKHCIQHVKKIESD